ncbi:MAG: hypothetical protein GYB64_12105, partial [Chloroflexi bacterium]|nr:hypothetical protein [Chloroflexota bacterium]
MPSFPSDVDTDVAAMYIAWDFAVRGSGKNSDDLPYLLDLYEIAFRRVVMLHDEAFGEE